MTYEEFRRHVEFGRGCVTLPGSGKVAYDCSITVRVRRYVDPDLVVYMTFNPRFEDDLKEAMTEELWYHMQHDVGYTDNEMKRAYYHGYQDGRHGALCEPEKEIEER